MAHFHLAWELGGGLGHAVPLKMLAAALLARGHRVSMALRDLAHTRSVLADLHVPKLQAPVWLHRTVGLPANPSSLAEILLTCGYLEAPPLLGQVGGWRDLFGLLKPDLVIGDYAPTALLAARSMGVRSASIGLGFTMPPAGQPLPCLRDWEPIPEARLAGAEQRVLQVANAVLAHHAAAPYGMACELLLGDAPWVTAWPELDHYGRDAGVEWHGPLFLPSTGAPPQWPAGSGAKVFAYLKSEYAGHVDVLAALAQAGCRVLCYLPEVAGGRAPPVHAPNILYAQAPVPLGAALAEAQLCVCHAGQSTLAQSLLAGVPLLLLPMQLEQLLISRRVSAAGMGLHAPSPMHPLDWRQALRQLLGTPAHTAAARGFAARHRGFSSADTVDALVRQAERLVGLAR